MKIMKSLFTFLVMLIGAIGFVSCDPFGKDDPGAGNQTYPSRSVVATYDFEYSAKKPLLSDLDSVSQPCEVIKDDSLGSNVLHLNKTGGVRIVNPFNTVKLQKGAGIALWVKTDSTDLDRPIITIGNASADSAYFYFTPNGQIVYHKAGQLESLDLDENDPIVNKTRMMTPGIWHFVALQISNSGYQFYVDGYKSLSGSAVPTGSTSFNYQSLVDFINHAPFLYIGTKRMGDVHNGAYFDDLSLIRNQMIQSDWTKTASGGTTAFKYVVGSPTLTVGTEDNQCNWWTQFSNYFRIPSDGVMHFRFTNHTLGDSNWQNWCLCLSTDADRAGDGYSEYFVIRSDDYGWGNTDYNSGNFNNTGYPTSDDEWTNFRKNMEGASIDVTINRSGAVVNITATATCLNGKVYVERYSQKCGDGTQVVRAFFIADHSHFVFDPSGCTVGTSLKLSTTVIGTEDNQINWWTAFSDYFQISSGNSLHLGFTNYTLGDSNWQNWCLCLSTDANRAGDGYSEYFVIRSDDYGWGNTDYNSGNFNNTGYPTSDDEWTDFRKNMEGAKEDMTISRSGTMVNVIATATCLNGKVYVERYSQKCGDGTQGVRVFLITDHSHLVMAPDECYNILSLFK